MACTSWGQPESANLNFVDQLLKLRCSMAASELLTGISLHVNSVCFKPSTVDGVAVGNSSLLK
jgi:hypothetical protein